MSHKSPFEPQSRGKMPENWPFALRHEHNLCKEKSCMEKCLPRLQRCHGSLKETVSPKKAADRQTELTERCHLSNAGTRSYFYVSATTLMNEN